MHETPTIVALSSGQGRAGVAVVRLSGSRVRFVLETIAGSVPDDRRASLRTLRRPDTGEAIDRGLVLFFPGPESFTGEDCGELQVHGSPAVIGLLLRLLAALPGVRLAEAGEFTRRAFEAGKLDLAAVEGLADLIDSETEWQRRQALAHLDGALGRACAGWREGLIEALALIEAELDFSDEDDVGESVLAAARHSAGAVRDSLELALGSFEAGERVRDGFPVVLTGPPNAGKSSLLNALARRDVAIVSAVPGTTRDALEVRLDLAGLPVVLVDTAGLRDSDDPVEMEGIRRARARAERAALVLDLCAIDSEPDRYRIHGPDVLELTTKIDRGGSVPAGRFGVSAFDGTGLAELGAAIRERLSGRLGGEAALVTRERQRAAIGIAVEALTRLHEAPWLAPELVAEELRAAMRGLDRLIGRVDVEQVLDRLFSAFCIGK